MKTPKSCFAELTGLKVFFLCLSVVAGVLLPVQGSINATLLEPTNSQIAPAAISFLIGTLSLAIVFKYDPRSKKRKDKDNQDAESTYDLIKTAPKASLFIPGLIGSYYVTLSAVLGRKLGFSLFSVCIVAGNLVSAAFADHIGAFGLHVRKINYVRGGSMVLVLIGSAISVYERINLNTDDEETLEPWKIVVFILLSFLSGCCFPIQLGLNAKLTRHMKSLPHRITLWNFTTGTVYLIIATALSMLLPSVDRVTLEGLRGLEGWKFIGGVLGASYVFLSVYLGPKVGVSFFLVFAIGGQLVMALIIDNYGWFESNQLDVTASRIVGVLIVFIALVIFRFEDRLRLRLGCKPNEEIEDDATTEIDEEQGNKDIQLS